MAEDLIVADPHILDGKPCVRGTRLSVEFLLELAASGATHEQILAQYPRLTREGLSAAFRYNFGRVHQTIRVTPAMEAGIADHVWSIEEIVGLSRPA